MKGLNFFLILVAAVIIGGCATTRQGSSINLNSPPGTSMGKASKADINSAIAKQKELITENPNNSYVFVHLSRLLNENKQFDEAITAAKMAIELKPDDPAAYCNLGYAYGMKGQYHEAFDALRKATRIYSKDALELMGRFLLKKGDYSQAAKTYKKAVAHAPVNGRYRQGLAMAYFNMGKYDDALTTISKAINFPTYKGIGVSFKIERGFPLVVAVTRKGPASRAGIEAGDRIIKVNGMSTDGWNSQKFIENVIGPGDTKVVLTIKRGNETLKKNVKRGFTFQEQSGLPPFGSRSMIYRKMGKFTEAMEDAEKAFALAPSDKETLLSLGAANLDRTNYDEAIKLLSSVKDSSTARILEATAYAKKGNIKKAIDIYEDIPDEDLFSRSVPLWSDRSELLATLKPVARAYRENAQRHEAQGRFQDALNEYAKALTLEVDAREEQELRNRIFQVAGKMPGLPKIPEDAQRHISKAKMLVKEGYYKDAVAEFKKAIRLAPFSPGLYFNTALLFEKLKNYPAAIGYMKIYLKAAPDAPNARAVKDQITALTKLSPLLF